MSPSDAAWQQLISTLHASGRKAALAITGGGSGAIGELLRVPGGSRLLIEAQVPYDGLALATFLGFAPAQASSSDTAIAMARTVRARAARLVPASTDQVGLGATARCQFACAAPRPLPRPCGQGDPDGDAAVAAGCSVRGRCSAASARSARRRPTPPWSVCGWSWLGRRWRTARPRWRPSLGATASPTPAASPPPTRAASANSHPRRGADRQRGPGLAICRPAHDVACHHNAALTSYNPVIAHYAKFLICAL